jgi:acetylornithine/N-succinyldiaminopimelate aminotransferase
MGRTGTFLALEQYNVKADIVTLAKGIAGGIPAGAVLAGEKAAGVFTIGDHGSTFGGNPVAAAAGIVVLETINNPAFLKEIKRKGEKLLSAIKAHPKVKEARGIGLMIGFDIESDSWALLEAGIARADNTKTQCGLLMLSSGPNTIRLLPPYSLTDSEIEQGLEILSQLLG